MKAKRKPDRGRPARPFDQDDDLEEEFYERRPRPQRRGRPLRKLLIFLLLLAGLVAAFPMLVAKTPLGNLLLSFATPQGTMRVSMSGASLGWFSPPALNGVEVRAADGKPLATIESIRTSRSPWALASNWHDLGEIEITRPVIYLAVRPDGTNLQDALRPWLETAHGDTAPVLPAESDATLPAVSVKVVDGTLLVEEMATGQRYRVCGINAELDSRGVSHGLPPLSLTGQLDVGAPLPTGAVASFALSLTNEQGRQQLSWQLQSIPLAVTVPWLRLAIPGADLSGGLFGQGTASWSTTAGSPLSECATEGSITLQGVDATAPALSGDRIRLSSVELPWRVSSQPAGVTIDDLQLKSDVGRFAARGTLDPAFLASGRVNLSARHDVELQGEVDLAKLAAMLPHLLRIRGDTTITGGMLQLAGRSQPIDGGQSLSGMVRAADLAAKTGGRAVTWDKPVDASFELRREQGNLRIESLKCQSEFLSVAAAGTPRQLTANATFDLNRLAAQLGQFVDLSARELAGSGTAHVDWQRSDGDQFAASANSEISQLRVAFRDGKVWAEPRLALKAETAGTLDPETFKPLRIEKARLNVDAEGDQLVGQITEPVDLATPRTAWPFTIRVTGEISRWLTRARPWFSPDPWQASGQSDIAAEVRASAQAVDISNLNLSVSNLRVTGVGWSINEPRVELAGDLRWNGATGEVAAHSAQLVSSAVSLAAKDVRLQPSGPGSPQANGVAAFRADVARLASWRVSTQQPPTYQPRGMVTGNVRFNQQADRVTGEFTATGEGMALVQLAGQAVPGAAQTALQTIWQEPQINVRGTTAYEPTADRLAFQQLQVQSQTLAVIADGVIDKLSSTADVNATGSLNYDLAQITPLLRPLVGDGIQLAGRETAKFQAAGSLRPHIGHWSQSLAARGELPWASADVYGLPIGPGKLSAALSGGTVRVEPLSIAVAEGELTTAPQVRLDPAPREVTLPPGPLVTNVRISPQVSEAMLKYIAPVLSGATQSEGQFSLNLASGARVPLDEPKQAEMAGQLTVHSVRVVPGPMAKQWVALAQQIESIAKRRDLASLGQRQPATLLSIHDQQVNFRVVDGRVYHQGMQFQVGDVVMRSEGSVGFDESVAILLEVPIQDKWIDGQALLVGLKGQTLKIPISGTLRQPRMDQSAVAGLSQQLLQGAAQQAIGGELNKALDKFLKPR